VAGVLAGLPRSLRARHLVPAEVAGEVRDRESRELLEWMIEAGLVEVVEAPVGGVERLLPARLASRLSRADLAVLAVALEARRGGCGRVLVATDDYALQEAAVLLGLEVVPVRYRGSRVLGRGKRVRGG